MSLLPVGKNPARTQDHPTSYVLIWKRSSILSCGLCCLTVSVVGDVCVPEEDAMGDGRTGQPTDTDRSQQDDAGGGTACCDEGTGFGGDTGPIVATLVGDRS